MDHIHIHSDSLFARWPFSFEMAPVIPLPEAASGADAAECSVPGPKHLWLTMVWVG